MPRLIIDDREIEVPQGTKVIEAAERLGIMIPRFCYHPALGSVGACRVCAVGVLEGPIKGIQMSCMLDAMDGMVVSTTDPEAVDFRRHVIEWLMLNHPHDCPVCDEGGHCLLQDMTVSGGHGIRRYEGPKRTYPDQDLGPLVQHEMNRCIHCYRCSRFYQEITGYRDLGVMQIANRTYFGRKESGILESPFAGNLSDICPTGVYTDKPSRFFGRRWDYERSRTLCIHCSLGCHTVTSVRYRQVVRQEARMSRTVNGWFICDRGRFGFTYASAPDRPREGHIDGNPASWDESIREAADRLSRSTRRSGADSVAVLASPRCSLETMAMAARISAERGWSPPVFQTDSWAAAGNARAVLRLEPELAVSQQEVASADMVLVVGADPLNEAPMLTLALRKARLQGARIFVLDPRPVSLPFDFDHLQVRPSRLAADFSTVLKSSVDPQAVSRCGGAALKRFDAFPEAGDGGEAEAVRRVSEALGQSLRPLIIVGTGWGSELPALAADGALWLRAMGKAAGIFCVMDGPNAFGAALIDREGGSLERLLEAIETGAVRSLLVVESDPFGFYPDQARLHDVMSRLELIVVLDCILSPTARQAHVFVPTATVFGSGGCFVNQEGRLQVSETAFRGGTPVAITGAGDHPPRQYGMGIPGADPKSPWRTLATLNDREIVPNEPALRESIWKWLAGTREPFARLVPKEGIPDEGVRIGEGAAPQARFLPCDPWPASVGDDEFELVLTEWTFGTEILSALSPPLQKVERPAAVQMNPGDAKRLGLAEGDETEIAGIGGALRLPVSISERTVPGVLVVPRHHRIDWRIFGPGPIRIPSDRIRAVGSRRDETP
ncbi:MAG: NADH-quinone oxidoreductase subunit NuoG [Desulfobacterales bacterium]